MSACGPCEVWWGLVRPKLQPPLPLLSPPLLTHWLSKSLPLPAAPTHQAQQGALITRSPRPKGMGGAVSQGTKSQLPRLWGGGPGPLNGGDGGSTGREGGGGLSTQVRACLCSSWAYLSPATPPGSHEFSVSHQSSPVPLQTTWRQLLFVPPWYRQGHGSPEMWESVHPDHSKASEGQRFNPGILILEFTCVTVDILPKS